MNVIPEGMYRRTAGSEQSRSALKSSRFTYDVGEDVHE